jgi:hypothetical protein
MPKRVGEEWLLHHVLSAFARNILSNNNKKILFVRKIKAAFFLSRKI